MINFLILSPPFKKNPAKQLFLLKTFCSLCSHKKYIYIKFNRIFLFFWPFFHPRSHTEHWFFIFYFFSQFTQFQIWKKKNFCLKKSNVTRFSLIFYFYLNEIPPCVVYLEKTFLFYSWIFLFYFFKNDFFCVCVFLTHEKQCFSWFFFFPLVSDVEILKWNIVGFKGWFFAFMSTNIDFIMFKWFYRNVMKTEVWDWEYPPSPTD